MKLFTLNTIYSRHYLHVLVHGDDLYIHNMPKGAYAWYARDLHGHGMLRGVLVMYGMLRDDLPMHDIHENDLFLLSVLGGDMFFFQNYPI